MLHTSPWKIKSLTGAFGLLVFGCWLVLYLSFLGGGGVQHCRGRPMFDSKAIQMLRRPWRQELADRCEADARQPLSKAVRSSSDGASKVLLRHMSSHVVSHVNLGMPHAFLSRRPGQSLSVLCEARLFPVCTCCWTLSTAALQVPGDHMDSMCFGICRGPMAPD